MDSDRPGCSNCGDGVPTVCAVCEKYNDDAVVSLSAKLSGQSAAFEEMERHYEAVSARIIAHYGKVFPHYAFTDPESALDLMLAEITTARSERDIARKALSDIPEWLIDERHRLSMYGDRVCNALMDLIRGVQPRISAALLRRLANEECRTVFDSDLPHITQNELLDMASEFEATIKSGEKSGESESYTITQPSLASTVCSQSETD